MYTLIFQFFRQLSVFTSVLVLILAMVTGCSSSGDDEGGGGIPGTVPNLLNYEISQVSGVSMILAVNPQATATVSSMLLNGTLDRTSEIITLNAQTLPAMDVSAAGFLNSLDPSFNDYQLRVISAATWTGDGDPTSGEFNIVSANELDTINVKVNNTGVDVTYLPNGVVATSIALTWQDFDDAFDNPQPGEEFAAVASFATTLLRLVYEQGELVVQTLEFIGENSGLMEEIGTVGEVCDMFPVNLPPDIVVANPGSFTVGWNDANNDISISSGDRVFLDFFECWVNEESDPIARLYNRGITFNNYTEVQSGNVITRVGFESPDGIVAGLVFDFLDITETEDDGINTVISSDNTITVSGGFSMVFTAP